MSPEVYFAYIIACIVVAVVPGPVVTLVIANSLTHGARAGLLNVAGTQLALALMMAVLVVGLASVIETMSFWFDLVRLLGAAYLIWMGLKLIRAVPAVDEPRRVPAPRGGFVLQGFLVMLSNPKVLLFFGAFIPQFVDPGGDPATQVALLGATAMATAALSDATYALLAGRAGTLLSQKRVRLVSKLSGGCLIGGGVWLALARIR
jgi:homoserine/homoserine lactone efflux protein